MTDLNVNRNFHRVDSKLIHLLQLFDIFINKALKIKEFLWYFSNQLFG